MKKRILTFFLAPASPAPLAALRTGLAAILLLQAAMLWRDLFELYGASGIMQHGLAGYLNGPPLPSVRLVAGLLARVGVGETQAIGAVFALYAASLAWLLTGLRPRLAAAAAWLTHMIVMSGHFTTYGVDSFAHIFLFYLIWMPSRFAAPASPEARLALRVVQLHLCVVYLASGVEKATGIQWRDGEAIWRSLMLPVYRQYDFSWMASFPWVAKAGAWGTLLVEIGYPFLIWNRRTRPLWIALTVGLHVGIALFLGLVTFGLVMALLTLCAFGLGAEPRETEEALTPDCISVLSH